MASPLLRPYRRRSKWPSWSENTLLHLFLPRPSPSGSLFLSASPSSASAFASVASNRAFHKSETIVLPPAYLNISLNFDQRLDDAGKKNDVLTRNLSATYADLSAPQWDWEEMPPAPVPRLDGYAVQIKNLLYVFQGYDGQAKVKLPKKWRIHTWEWQRMGDMSMLQLLWRGRLHVMGGSKENRHTTAVEHWSLAVKDGKALETQWTNEVPIPRGGPHRACVVVNDRLYVIGGQEGDFMPKPGSPIFKCSRRHGVQFGVG